jgi:hypothetical protein
MFFLLTECQPVEKPVNHSSLAFIIDKPNSVKEYFAQNKWNFPFQVDSTQPIWFGEFSDSIQIFADSNNIQAHRGVLFSRAVKFFINQGIDSLCGYRFGEPSMYRHTDSVYYRLSVEKYKNNRNPNAGCECAVLDSGRIHGYSCFAEFKVAGKDSLIFERCDD